MDEIFVCLDGSSWAEKTVALAAWMARAMGARLTFLRVVEDADELAAEETYMRDEAKRFGAQVRFVVSHDAARAIQEELNKNLRAVAIMATHGRTAWAEALLGSVALGVACLVWPCKGMQSHVAHDHNKIWRRLK